MRQIRRVSVVRCRPRNIVELLTQTYVRLNDTASTPLGLSIPIPAGTTGLTIAYYTRKLAGDFEGYYPIVDGANGIGGGFGGSSPVGGLFTAGGLWVDGQAFGYGPRYLYSYRRFVPVVVRTEVGASYGDGAAYFNMSAGGGVPRQYLLSGVDVAYVCVYYRRLSDAELASPLLPGDVDQRYTFAGYQVGDPTTPEQLGTGLDATLYY